VYVCVCVCACVGVGVWVCGCVCVYVYTCDMIVRLFYACIYVCAPKCISITDTPYCAEGLFIFEDMDATTSIHD
jgi:hypothetical protein